jgi:hypothetical protein
MGVEWLGGVLMIVHAGIASATKTPELELTEPEANQLGKSVGAVMDEFGFQPDPRTQAIVGLVITAGMIYGPRMYLIRERIAEPKKAPASDFGAFSQ